MQGQGSLGRRLRLIRAEQKLSLRQAARQAGLAKETLGDLERGKRHPTDVTLAKLADVYGISLQELFDLEEEPQEPSGEMALTGTGPKAEAPETGQAEGSLEESLELFLDMAHRQVLKNLREAKQASTRAVDSELVHSELARLLERPGEGGEGLPGSYMKLMEGYVRLERENEHLKQENERLKQKLSRRSPRESEQDRESLRS